MQVEASQARTWTRLVAVGAVAVGFAIAGLRAPSASARGDAEPTAAPGERGAALYGRDCVFCHGAEGQGSPRGVPITDAGEATTHYALVTGRMPLDDPDAVPQRGPTQYSDEDIAAITAHVAGFGDGPTLPDVGWRDADAAEGGRLYRLHCGACHGATAVGAALAYDRRSPPLFDAEPSVVAAAVVSGPGAMPAFGPDGFTDEELGAIVAYVQRLQSPVDRGGWPIFRTGRPDEALIALGVALPVLLVLAGWIARRPPRSEDGA
ncbi:c-type cytochrome [Acidimicrobiia bacterium EGI L10123]|uniref:c-type cytochrome n=1 Tax=Salinilacustrithrix flava TaxID=2957203 RepID=UPI003D7C22CD|nr:c-type cytochrome [Acidimicrobiia bacterium EGI L10123]